MANQGLTKTRVKMYKHKKLWMVMGVTSTMLALGTIAATPAQAATDDAGQNSVTTSTSAGTSAGSAALSNAKVTPASAEPATSATSGDGSTNSGQSATSGEPASATSEAGSEGSQAASSVGSTATSAASDGATSTTSASDAKSVASQATTSTAPTNTNPAPANQVKSSRMAAPAVPTKATDTTTPDDTVVTIADADLSNAIKKALFVDTSKTLTVGDIRHYNSTQHGRLTVNTDATPVTTLAGIENLNYLTSGPISLTIRIKDSATVSMDLSPLATLSLYQLTIESTYLGYVNLKPLTAINTDNLWYVDINPNESPYQGHQYGMTNAQLKELSGWLTAMGNNKLSGNYIGLTGNCLTDFSSLAGIHKSGVFIAAGGQVVMKTNETPVNVVTGQSAVFTGMTITGVQGETINDAFGYTFNTADGTEQRLTNLGNNQYQIDDIQPISGFDGYIVYGNLGIPYSDKWEPGRYVNVTYSNGVSFRTDMRIFQPANFQSVSTVTVKYVDTKGRSITGLPDQVVSGTKIGDSFDLSQYMHVANYVALATNGPIKGTFSQNPQILYIMMIPNTPAGQVNVAYVDDAGNVLATDTATYPNGQIVDLTYQTTQKAFDGYTFKGMAEGSLAANGNLTAAGGTVTYVYTKNVVLTGDATVTYVDDTTGQTLATDVLTGDQGTTADYTTANKVASYLKAGYELVNDEVPTDGIVYGEEPASYVVHLTHQVTAITDTEALQKTITQTIHYVYSDGPTAAADKVATIQFTRTGTTDAVTGVSTYTDWVTEQPTGFAAQDSPVIADYTADQLVVAAVPVTAASSDMVMTVTYMANPVKPTDPDTGDNGGGTTTPTDPDTGDNGSGTTTPTDPDTGDNGGGTTTPTNPDPDNNGGSTTTPTTPDTDDNGVGDAINVATPEVTTPTDVDSGQADHIQVAPVKKATLPAKTTETKLAPAGDTINAAPQALGTTKAAVKTQVVKTATHVKTTTDSKPAASASAAKTGLPQTDEAQRPTTAWLGLGLLFSSLLTAAGFKSRQH
ncbi:mucin-binding protein [Lactiplantibacillus songbeiensis]|uniref:MucBP domain-containing protein n=1 Tax=Lactiplantibacillus songbeiensis TaxID=2559920 RepID=A0ABW4BVZ9_9LACO|nr:MucBP domain-containing protein [Lactiplantibacillus songbeiensis]